MLIDEIKNKEKISVGESLVLGYAAVRSNLTAILFVLLIIYFPINLLSGYITLAINNIGAGIDFTAILSSPEMIEKFVTTPEYISMVRYNFAGTLTDMILYPFGSMAVVYITKEALQGKNPAYTEALSAAFSNAGRFILSMIVFSICVSLLTLLGVIPGIFLAVVWSFYVYAIILDDCKGTKSLGRSRELVKGKWWRTFLYMIVFYAFSYAVAYLVGTIFMFAPDSYFTIVLSGVILSFINMIFVAAKTVIYINYQGNSTAVKNIISK
jgi:hypothetical protein